MCCSFTVRSALWLATVSGVTPSLSPGLPGLFKCHVSFCHTTIFPLTKWIGGSGVEDDLTPAAWAEFMVVLQDGGRTSIKNFRIKDGKMYTFLTSKLCSSSLQRCTLSGFPRIAAITRYLCTLYAFVIIKLRPHDKLWRTGSHGQW